MDDAAELSLLSRELLRCQLDDLDVFLNNARQLQLPSLPPLPPEERQQEASLPLPPLDSTNVLEAQLQNVEEFLAQMRGSSAHRNEELSMVPQPLPQRLEMEGAGLVPGGPRPGTLRFEAPARGGPGKRPWTMIPEKEKLEVDGEEPTEAGFLFDLETECYFRAWSSIASTMRRAKRQKREENSRRYLGKKAKAQVMWALVDGLYGYEVCRFVRNADTLSRGQRMRLAPRGRSGTFLSCIDRGSRCKVLFDGKEEAEMVATEELLKVQIGAHPYAAGVAFLVWNLFRVSQLQLRVARLSSDLGYHRGWGKIGRAVLRMTSLTDARLAVKLTLRRWHSFVAHKEEQRHRLDQLHKVFKAWFEVLVMVKHNNALEQLELTQKQLQKGKQKCLEAETRTEKMKGRLEELIFMEWDLWCSWVLFAWQWAVKLCRSTKEFALQARLKRAEQTLKLSDSFGQAQVDLKPTFQAWSSLVKRDRKRKIMAARWMYGVGSDTLEEVFRSWRGLKYVEYERVSQQLRRKEQDFAELQGLSSHLYTFSQQSCGRAQRMESALLAAERALDLSASRGNDLERQVVDLQSGLQQQEEADDLQRRQYEFQMTRRSDAETASVKAQLQVLRAELSASEDQQVHLHQQMGHLRSESERQLRLELEELALEAQDCESSQREHEQNRHAAEQRGFDEETQASEHLRMAEDFRERQRVAMEKVRTARARSVALRQHLPDATPDVDARPPPKVVPASPVEETVEEQHLSEADEAEEESGYTREEWMDFFAEEGLSADELKALDQIFDYLNLSGDIPVDTLKDALSDTQLRLPPEIRESLIHFLHDVA